MHTIVNGVRIWFDVEGAGLVPDGPRMRERPTLVLLHGGPGFDHSTFKPAHSTLVDVAQLVFVDHRGNGRSVKLSPTDSQPLMAGLPSAQRVLMRFGIMGAPPGRA